MKIRLQLLAISLGLVVFYLGERIYSELSRWILSGFGLALMVAAVGMAAWRFKGAVDERRLASRRILVHYGICALGILVYVL